MFKCYMYHYHLVNIKMLNFSSIQAKVTPLYLQ